MTSITGKLTGYDGNDIAVDGKKYPMGIKAASWVRDHNYKSGITITLELDGKGIVFKAYPSKSPEKPQDQTVMGIFRSLNKFNQIGIENKKGIHTIGVSPELLAREKENFGTNVGFQVTVVITGLVATDIKWTGPGPQSSAPTAKEILEKNIKDAAPPQPKQDACTSPAAAVPVQKAEEPKKDEWGEEFKRFKDLLSSVKRDGIPEFLQYLIDKTDFFIAPSSTKYHDARNGGLLHHSLRVYDNLTALSKIYTVDIPEESRILISLLHDVCKTNFYRLEKKQLPRKNERGDRKSVV